MDTNRRTKVVAIVDTLRLWPDPQTLQAFLFREPWSIFDLRLCYVLGLLDGKLGEVLGMDGEGQITGDIPIHVRDDYCAYIDLYYAIRGVEHANLVANLKHPQAAELLRQLQIWRSKLHIKLTALGYLNTPMQ